MKEGTLPPKVLVAEKWRDMQDPRIMLEGKADTSLLGLIPTCTDIPYDTSASEQKSLPLDTLEPMNMVAQLLKTPFLSPTLAYVLVQEISASLQLAAAIQPLLACLRGGLKESSPGINNLGVLEIKDHITGGGRICGGNWFQHHSQPYPRHQRKSCSWF